MRPPGRHIVTYTMQLADERLLAPMAVFHPDMFGLQKAVHVLRVAEKYRSDPSDPYDDDYLVQTQSRHEQVQLTLSSPTVCMQYPPQMCTNSTEKIGKLVCNLQHAVMIMCGYIYVYLNILFVSTKTVGSCYINNYIYYYVSQPVLTAATERTQTDLNFFISTNEMDTFQIHIKYTRHVN